MIRKFGIPRRLLKLMEDRREKEGMTLSVDQTMEVLKEYGSYDRMLPEDALRKRAKLYLDRFIEGEY